MELTYNELRKRDVINVSDGRCLGRIIDLRLSFPEGIMVGIVVPGRRTHGLLKLFDKSQLYIDESRIIKIGGDVILVDINCGDLCSSSMRLNKSDSRKKHNCPPPHCPPKCKPQYPPNSHGQQNYAQNSAQSGYDGEIDFSILSGGSDRINTDDY